MSEGWIKLHRRVMETAVWGNPKTLMVWVWCLLKATHKDIEIRWGGKQKTLKVGQFVFGRNKAGKELPIPPSTIWYNLLLLEKWGNLNIKTDKWGSIVSICSWSRYQDKVDSKVNSRLTAVGQPIDTNKNVRMKELDIHIKELADKKKMK